MNKKQKRNKHDELIDNPLSEEFSNIVSTPDEDKISRDIPFKHNGEWANLTGKRLQRASEINPLVSVRGGIDDASCLEVEVIDAAVYLPLTNKKLQPVFSSKKEVEEKEVDSNNHHENEPISQNTIDGARNELALLKKQRKSGEVNEESFVASKTIILKKMEKIRRLEMKNKDMHQSDKQHDDQKPKKKKSKKKKKKFKIMKLMIKMLTIVKRKVEEEVMVQ
jgi:hypothetical protein